MPRGGRSWTSNLNAAQENAVRSLREKHGGTRNHGGEGWRVLVMPTTRPATYVELRYYPVGGGRLARWVIEQDGTVSAHNDFGRLSALVSP